MPKKYLSRSGFDHLKVFERLFWCNWLAAQAVGDSLEMNFCIFAMVRLEFFNLRFWLPLLLHLFNTFLHFILATNETLDVFFLDGETLFLASSILMNDFVFNNKFGLVF